MYLEHFGLGINPFGLSPKLDFLYKSGTFEESMAHLIYGLDNQEAIVLITGPIGTGKTMALQSFLVSLGSRFEFALVTNTRVTAVELLKLVMEDLGVALSSGLDKSDLLIMFKDYLLKASHDGKKVLIVVDEAQNLSADVLEEIRLLTNLGQGDTQPVQIILVGQPELEAAVNRPDLAQLRQRIRVHYRLNPLSREETAEYVHHRMRVAGADREIFTDGAIDTIYQFSRGTPRLINTMAGDALLSAFVAGHDRVLAGDVEKDRDLAFESGPAPLNAPTDPMAPAGAVKRDPQIRPIPTPPPPPPTKQEQPTVQPVASPQVAPTAPPLPPENPGHRGERRRNDRGHPGLGRNWLVAAILVLAVAGLYYFGYLDGLIETISGYDVVRDSPIENTEEIDTDLAADNSPSVDDSPAGIGLDAAMPEPGAAQLHAAAAEKDLVRKMADEAAVEVADVPVPVQTEIMKEPTSISKIAGATTLEDVVYIHVSSFRTAERAQSLARQLKDESPGAVVMEHEVRGTNWYRVYLGPYTTSKDAHMDGLRLKAEGVVSYYRLARINPNDGI